ncbi:hypothetical protein EPO15_14095 [bacterium]|nr:MAG: hypothetical protein EPO15_14095 [bacterium]
MSSIGFIATSLSIVAAWAVCGVAVGILLWGLGLAGCALTLALERWFPEPSVVSGRKHGRRPAGPRHLVSPPV